MRFKPGDTIMRKNNRYPAFSSVEYTIKQIANGDESPLADTFYIMESPQQGIPAQFYDTKVVDNNFTISLRNILKNL